MPRTTSFLIFCFLELLRYLDIVDLSEVVDDVRDGGYTAVNVLALSADVKYLDCELVVKITEPELSEDVLSREHRIDIHLITYFVELVSEVWILRNLILVLFSKNMQILLEVFKDFCQLSY